MKQIIALATLVLCVCVATGCSTLACKDYFRKSDHPYSDLTTREQTQYAIGSEHNKPYIEWGAPHTHKLYNGYYSVKTVPGSYYSDYSYFTRKHPSPRKFRSNRKFFEGYIAPRRLDTRDRYIPKRQYHDYDKK